MRDDGHATKIGTAGGESCQSAAMDVITGAGVWSAPDASGATYVEQFASADLSVGTYCLRAGSTDPQSPHGEDEIYVVTAGTGRFTGGDTTVDVSAGSVLYVPAGEPHRFHDITQDLCVLVFFAPPEGSR